MGFRVEGGVPTRCLWVVNGGSGFRVQDSGSRVQGSGSRVQGLGSRVQVSGLRVDG